MMLIENKSEQKLLATLERLHAKAHKEYCVYIKLSRQGYVARALLTDVINVVRMHVAPVGQRLYVCEDGDIFVLAPHICAEGVQALSEEVAQRIGMPSAQGVLEVYESDQQLSLLSLMLRDKQRRIEEKSLPDDASWNNVTEFPGQWAV